MMQQQYLADTAIPSDTLRDEQSRNVILIPHHGRDEHRRLGVFLVTQTGSSENVTCPRTVPVAQGSTSTRFKEWHRLLLEDQTYSGLTARTITWAHDADYTSRLFDEIFGSVYESIFKAKKHEVDKLWIGPDNDALPEIKVIGRSVGKARPIKKLKLHAELFD